MTVTSCPTIRGEFAISKVQSSSECEGFPAGLDDVIGVDKLWLTTPVRRYAGDEAWRTIGADGRRDVDVSSNFGARVHVRVYTDQGSPWATISFNPSRFLDPQGCTLAPIRELPETMRLAFDVAGGVVDLPGSPKSARVKRVDVSRDFSGISGVAIFLRAFADAPRGNAKFTRLSLGPRGLVEGVATGSKSGGRAELYDKYIESKGRVPEGTLRFEAQCRGWARDRARIERGSDLNAENLARLAWDRWNWAGFGASVASISHALAIISRSDLKPATKRNLEGYLALRYVGHIAQMSSATRSRYNRIMKGLGIVVSSARSIEDVRCLDLLGGVARRASLPGLTA